MIKKTKEKVLFRLIVTPCCGQMLCWVQFSIL
jgi:hypothetical protein